MKAITLWQPWASLAAHGVKRCETRGWATKHRGPLAIHAALRPVTLAEIKIRRMDQALAQINVTRLDQLPLGVVVGIVNLVDVVRTEELTAVPRFESSLEFCLGKFGPGRFAWKLETLMVFPKPIPLKGQQGLFETDHREVLEWA